MTNIKLQLEYKIKIIGNYENEIQFLNESLEKQAVDRKIYDDCLNDLKSAEVTIL